MKTTIISLTFLVFSIQAYSQQSSYVDSNINFFLIRISKLKGEAPEVKLQAFDKVNKKNSTLVLKTVKSGNWWAGTYSVSSQNENGKNVDIQFKIEGKKEPLHVLPITVDGKKVVALFPNALAAADFAAKNPSLVKNAGTADLPPTKESKEAIDYEKMRLDLELRESEKRSTALKNYEGLSKEEQKRKSKAALNLMTNADDLYAKGQYKESASLYAQSLAIDPTLDAAYYKYGVSLYKTEEFNQSLVMLSVGEGGTDNKAEHEYYKGLNLMKLKEYDKALNHLYSSKDENDPEISAMAAFLAGNIEFQLQKYKESKENFEFVIDNSKDPKLDTEAEKKIEEIDRIQAYLESLKEIMRYSFNTGFSYDENVLNISQTNSASNTSGYRFSYGGSVFGKIYKDAQSELGGQVTFADIYSLNTKWKGDRTLQAADPLILVFALPYRRQFELSKRGYLWSIQPSTTTLVMDVDNVSRRRILQSETIDTDISFQWAPVWSSGYRLQLNKDTSFLVAAEDDDQSSYRTTIGTTQTRLLDPKAEKTLGADLSFVKTVAKGMNNNNEKYVFGLIFGFPAPWWNVQSSLKGEYTNSKYINNPNKREDSVSSLALSGAKAFSNGLSWSLSYQYISSYSNISSNKYDKSVVSTLLSYSGSVKKK